jgi:hypothetical protein
MHEVEARPQNILTGAVGHHGCSLTPRCVRDGRAEANDKSWVTSCLLTHTSLVCILARKFV